MMPGSVSVDQKMETVMPVATAVRHESKIEARHIPGGANLLFVICAEGRAYLIRFLPVFFSGSFLHL